MLTVSDQGVRQIVEDHGEKIWAERNRDEGCCFIIAFLEYSTEQLDENV